MDDSVVLVEGEQIRDAGQTVIPDLVDLHVHFFGEPEEVRRQMGLYLAFGVTTVRSIGVDDNERLELIRAARRGEFPAPRILTAGCGSTPSTAVRPDSSRSARGDRRRGPAARHSGRRAHLRRRRCLPSRPSGGDGFLAHGSGREPMDEEFISFVKEREISFAPTLTVI